MEISITKLILAAVITGGAKVEGMPVFYVDSEEQQKKAVLALSRILEAVAHDLGNGVTIVVKH